MNDDHFSFAGHVDIYFDEFTRYEHAFLSSQSLRCHCSCDLTQREANDGRGGLPLCSEESGGGHLKYGRQHQAHVPTNSFDKCSLMPCGLSRISRFRDSGFGQGSLSLG